MGAHGTKHVIIKLELYDVDMSALDCLLDVYKHSFDFLLSGPAIIKHEIVAALGEVVLCSTQILFSEGYPVGLSSFHARTVLRNCGLLQSVAKPASGSSHFAFFNLHWSHPNLNLTLSHQQQSQQSLNPESLATQGFYQNRIGCCARHEFHPKRLAHHSPQVIASFGNPRSFGAHLSS